MVLVANVILFLTVKEFWRSVKFWPHYSKLNLAHFFGTQYICCSNMEINFVNSTVAMW